MSQESFETRLGNLGLTDDEADGQARRMITDSLAELTRWVSVPDAAVEHGDPTDTDCPCDAAMIYALGRPRTTPKNAQAVDEAMVAYEVEVVADAADVSVTPEAPLILDGDPGIWLFDNVTVQEGGQIIITGTGHFQCSTLTKAAGSGNGGGDLPPNPTMDIVVERPATPGKAQPPKPDTPGPAEAGTDAAYDCCGNVTAKATDGAAGQKGTGGTDGDAGDTGVVGPTVVLSLGKVSGLIHVQNRGGAGGPGANGGDGSDGQAGGDGGQGALCGEIRVKAGNGGSGGDGGAGGKGGQGGDGGHGGDAFVVYQPLSKSDGKKAVGKVVAHNDESDPGAGGTGGLPGWGGAGGSGRRAGADGAAGKRGRDGRSGQAGEKGTLDGSPPLD